MKTLDLAGRWTLLQGGEAEAIPATVPGDNLSALYKAKKIADPYRGKNELDLQWIGRVGWTYARTFKVSAALLAEDSVVLTAENLDTFATIRINGKTVGKTENAFRRYRFEVKPALKAGENEIQIVFAAHEPTVERLAKKLPYPIPHGTNPVQSMHRNLARKCQCHSGWDWGPCLMVTGIYGELSLSATSEGRIEHVITSQSFKGKACTVTVTTEVEAVKAGKSELVVKLGTETVKKTVSLKEGLNSLTEKITVRNAKRWWPNGYGKQVLYSLSVTVGGDQVEKKLGLRELELVTEEDKKGLSFVIRVNGVDIFCKGANWIPSDAMPERQTREVYDDLLSSAADAHMNMIRVWGGGQYERDAFYELCDEKGLLIWHDFMFACSLYPAHKDFLSNVRAEAEYQVKRLRDHASLALWCGNNENVAALGWYEESRKNRDVYLVDYDRLNEGVLGSTVDNSDATRTFWPSSPCGGRDDYSDCFHDDSRGDMHYWEVWHGGKSFDSYYDVVPRFCSEFGYQSFPSLEVIDTYADRDQWNLTAPVMEHHQRNRGGNSKIIEMFSRYFRMPEGFENFVYLSQVQQGVAIRTAVEYWRSLRPVCMGALYWQINDNWPVCSWASINYGGKWKILHYMAKRFFAPVMLTVFQRKYGQPVEVWGVNDKLETQSAAMTVKVCDFSGKVLKKLSKKVTLAKNSSKKLAQYKVSELTDREEETFLVVELKVGRETIRNDLFFTEYKKCDLAKARVKSSVNEEKGELTVTLEASAPAFFVHVDAEGVRGEFDDNAVTLLPGEKRTLTFTPKEEVTRAKLAKAITVRHLRETYR
ncbi:MAG: beta-mannosidase [Planctomycetota bacterium]|jgi:beta-mannosidase